MCSGPHSLASLLITSLQTLYPHVENELYSTCLNTSFVSIKKLCNNANTFKSSRAGIFINPCMQLFLPPKPKKQWNFYIAFCKDWAEALKIQKNLNAKKKKKSPCNVSPCLAFNLTSPEETLLTQHSLLPSNALWFNVYSLSAWTFK